MTNVCTAQKSNLLNSICSHSKKTVDETLKRTVSGRLVHANGDPLIDQKLDFCIPGWFKDRPLAKGVSDPTGRFEFNYNVTHSDLKKTKPQSYILRIIEQTIPSERKKPPERIVNIIPVHIRIQELAKDLGLVTCDFYESQGKFPALSQPENSSERPQQVTLGYQLNLVATAIGKKIKEVASNVFFLGTGSVQWLFGSDNPELKVTPNTTIELLLNGLYPGYFRNGENPNELVNVINWDRYNKESPPDLPNTSITLIKNGDELSVKEVMTQFPNEAQKIFKPNDKGFSTALYIFNSMALVKGEAVHHLGIGHLMTGQIALSFFRHIQDHVIKNLLLQHLDGVSEINRLGAGFIFGENGILNVSGLTSDGVDTVLEDTLGAFDYATFKPREPVVSTHRFAKAQKLYWDIVTKVVDKFFDENMVKITDPQTWPELFYMSENLTKCSLPFHQYEEQFPGENIQWNDRSEIDDSTTPGRVLVDGELRALRPLIKSISGPSQGDIDRLKQFCRYTLFVSTFFHWAIHSTQGKWGTNLNFGSLAPENHAKGKFGGTNKANAIQQLEVAHILTDFKAPSLVSNPYKNIYQPLINEILANDKNFKDLGYDIKKMHYGVII